MLVKRYCIFLLLLISFFSCKKVDIRFGDQYLDNGYTQLIKIDTFGVNLSTVYIDSFVTSGKGVSMVGGFNDTVFGQITTNNYFEMYPPAYSTAVVADSFQTAFFDSIALILKPDKSYFGDTTKSIRIDVNQLAESIVSNDGSGNLYNTSSFGVMPTVVGSRTLVLRPNADTLISIRLNDDIGRALLRKYQDPNDVDIKSNDAFVQYMYGFRISSPGNNQLIFGCSDSAIVRMYYKKRGLYSENRTLDLTLGNKAHHFNQVTVDRSKTVLKNLATARQLNSTATGNTAYTLYAAGAMAKFQFPTIRDVLKLPNYVKILKAVLIVRPIRGTYSGKPFVLPPLLRLSTTTQLNQVGDDLYYTDSDGSATIQNGNLVTDELYGESTAYSYDLTKYLLARIADGTLDQNGLLLIPFSPAMETQFGRLVMGNTANANGKMELQIIYAAVQ